MAPALPSHILAFGATGNIGKHIIQALVEAKPNFPKITVFTSENTVATKSALIQQWKSQGISIITGDITNAQDVSKAYRDVDTVISAVGRDGLEKQKLLIELAEQSETVKWFFPSEYGTDIEHNARSPQEKPHQKKLAIRKLVREDIKRLKVTYVVVGPYFEMWVPPSPSPYEALGGFDIEKKKAFLLGDGEGRIGFTTMPDTGKAVAAALRNPDASFNKALKIASFVVTPNEVLAEYEKQLGVKFQVKYIPVADLVELEEQLWKEGRPSAVSATLKRIWATGGTLYDKWDNDSIGLETDSLEAAVREAIRVQKS